MKKLILSTFTICSTIGVWAQLDIPKAQVYTGLSFGYSKDVQIFSMPVALSHSIGGNPHFRYIVGVRQNLGLGTTEFTFNDQKTLIENISSYSINLLGGFEYQSNGPWSGGFTLDLIGGSVGNRTYQTVGNDPVYYVEPEQFNLVLSKGTVNNEIFVGYKVNNLLTAKVGFSIYQIGLLYSNQKTPSIQARTVLYMPFVHLQYALWEQ